MAFNARNYDNPINWSAKVGRLFSIDIRIHLFFLAGVLFLVGQQMKFAQDNPAMSTGMAVLNGLAISAILFLIVLLHEFGHCFGARSMGGSAEEIMLWPLGGLASVAPPHRPWAHFVTAAAGPFVNVLIAIPLAAVIVALTGSITAIPINPFYPFGSGSVSSTLQYWVFSVWGINYILLVFNIALVFYPFDGGRMLQAWLWHRQGYGPSMMTATFVGMIGAVVLGCLGLLRTDFMLIGIAFFGYVTCHMMRQQIKQVKQVGTVEDGGIFGYDFSQGYTSLEKQHQQQEKKPGMLQRWRNKRAQARAEKERQREESVEKEIERILAKVSCEGMHALSEKEKRFLKQETERRQASR